MYRWTSRPRRPAGRGVGDLGLGRPGISDFSGLSGSRRPDARRPAGPGARAGGPSVRRHQGGGAIEGGGGIKAVAVSRRRCRRARKRINLDVDKKHVDKNT